MNRLKNITLACTGPDRLAEFWEQVLDRERREFPLSIDQVIVERPGHGPDLLFMDRPKGTERDPSIHLDLGTDDREATVAELRDLCASVRETKVEPFADQTNTWTVMEDPEGNDFCVAEY